MDSASALAWHAQRRKAILLAHPEVKRLYGHDPISAIWVAGLVVLQVGATVYAERLSWPVLLTLAYVVGAFPAHALGMLIHEAGHNLIFKRTWANKLIAVVANFPLGAPAAFEFRTQHAKHHRHLGDVDGKDTQAPTRHEARVIGGSALAKLVSFTFGRFYFKSRPENHVPFDRWVALNWATCITWGAIVLYFFGVKAFAFGLVSAMAAFGPHPIGARRLSEHLTGRRGQPTNSYYGPMNHIAVDVGYHVEHHDFPNVSWRRLRALHNMAPEFYELWHVKSWTWLMIAYVIDKRYRVNQYLGMGGDWLEEVLAQ